MTSERGQASVEWVGIVCLVAVVLCALMAVAPVVDGRSLGGFLASRFVCSVRGASCPQRADDVALRRAYGSRHGRLVRRFAPGIVYEPGEREVPVDFRRCRAVACARTPDDRDLDVHRTDAGHPVVNYTRVVRRGRYTYIQYWFYYPDSNTTALGSDRVWKVARGGAKRLRASLPGYPGFHEDDWEGYEVRVARGGRAESRATSHGGLQWCKWQSCRGRFGPATGWTRVSRGSHSGHIPLERHEHPPVAIRLLHRGLRGLRSPGEHRTRYVPQVPGVNLRERTSTPEGIRLVPLETMRRRGYRRRGKDVSPPWEKRLYEHPAEGSS